MIKKNSKHIAVSLVFAAFATTASAEGMGPVQAPSAVLSSPVTSLKSLSFPGTFGVPSAVAPRGGTEFVGLTYVNPRGGVAGAGGDASVSAGYTIGNPVDSISVTGAVSITGTQPLGDAGSFSLSASRLLQAGGRAATFIGSSTSNLANWGAGANTPNYSAYVSHLTSYQTGNVEIPIQFVVGYGTNNTRNGAVLDDGAFAGVGLGLTQNLSGSISFTRTQMNAGITAIVPNTNMGATLGVLDVADSTNRQQVSLSVGIGF
jgi:hypothetical protein